MNLTARSVGELQNTLSLLNQFEAEGVTDIRFVRERLHNHITQEFQSARIDRAKQSKRQARLPIEICPKCNKGIMRPAEELEGLTRIGCRCGYSRVVR